MGEPLYHAITPGDHFSPRTGSAIPTVVDGLARAGTRSASPYHHAVLVDRTTYAERYSSAEAVEYEGAPYPSRTERLRDAAAARLGMPRAAATRAFLPLAATLSSLPAGIVVAHNAPALPALLREGPHRVVLYAHNDILRSATRRELQQLSGVRSIVCVSDDLAERVAGRLPRRLRDLVDVVENGVDTDAFAPSAQGPGAPLRVLFVGRMVEEKGPDVLLRAAARIDRTDVEYLLVGSAGFDADAALTPYENSLRRLAADVRSHVEFRPFVDRAGLPSVLRSADVFAAPSRWPEPSGLTLGEAMASGLAVVTTRTGGIPSVVGDAALLVTPDSPDELADALRRLVDDAAFRHAQASAARKRAVSRDWDRSWRTFESILDRV